MEAARFFDDVVSYFDLSATEFDDKVDEIMIDAGGWPAVEQVLSWAYLNRDEKVLQSAHLALNKIYALVTLVREAGVVSPEGSAVFARIRFMLERHFLNYLEREAGAMMPPEIPDENFEAWLQNFIARHPAAEHHTYTKYLADQADLTDIRYYLVQESAIDANTDDFLAALQIGAPKPSKLEIAANYWDEMGEGDHNLLHSDLFKKALSSFSISHDETVDAFTLEALVCGNLQTMLSMRRELFHMGVGYFAATEQLVPERFKALKKGWERVGLTNEGAEYHLLHIEVDSHHTQRWYRNVVAPLGRQSANCRLHMLKGAIFRLYTSNAYLNALARKFASGAEAMAN
ncbi:Iron-containing redox enzyme family protein [Paraburkholderia kururiensis]|uniref:iron-containing redox enzyme family protein n=1 Tax=Paraburkholderia kururiensis TaxID=984307 RepID=UPI0039A59D15